MCGVCSFVTFYFDKHRVFLSLQRMKELKSAISVGNFSRRVALSLFIIYSSLLSLTFLSYQDEIIPPVVEFEFLIGDEDIDHSPHLEVIRYCQSKIRLIERQILGAITCSHYYSVKFLLGDLAFKKRLNFLTYNWYGDQAVLLSVFRI